MLNAFSRLTAQHVFGVRALAGSIALVAQVLLLTVSVSASDLPGSKDHPLLGRYEGSTIVYYKASGYDEYALLQAPHDYMALLDRNAVHDRSGPEWWKAQGRLTRIRYEIPAGRSSLEVLRNHEAALKTKGFEMLFNCADRACFSGALSDAYLLGQQIDTDNHDTSLYSGHARYVLAKVDGPAGAVYASILVGEDKDRVTAFIAVLETKSMEGDRIRVMDASTMQQAIQAKGNVSVYGIHFDFDKDHLRPESKPTLDEIAKLLASSAQLRLEVVGHTDNRGGHEYNLDLSRRRAANVVAALVRDYAIGPDRLTASGAGATSPVASNDNDDGRARNRRVELISR